ncbi:hypothetical protein LDENG_00123420 [Lucifuga dentata]|nr:hypothetical protein LDENG_00123420 [Lucifuga dentata]
MRYFMTKCLIQHILRQPFMAASKRCCDWSKKKEWAHQRRPYKNAVSSTGRVPLFGSLIQHRVLCFISKKLEIRYNTIETTWTQKRKRASRTGMNCLAIQGNQLFTGTGTWIIFRKSQEYYDNTQKNR